MVIVTTVLVADSRVYVVCFTDAIRRRRDFGDDGVSVDRNGFIWIVVVLPTILIGDPEAVVENSNDASGLVREIFLTEAISSPLTALMLH